MTYYTATIHQCFPSSREDGTLALIDVTADCGKLFAVYTDIEELLDVIEEYGKLPEGAREVLRNVSEKWWTSEYEYHEIIDDEPFTTIWCIKKMDLSPVIDSIKKRVCKVVSGIEFKVKCAIDNNEENDE